MFVYLYIISYYTFLKHIKDKKVQKNAIYGLERMLFMVWKECYLWFGKNAIYGLDLVLER